LSFGRPEPVITFYLTTQDVILRTAPFGLHFTGSTSAENNQPNGTIMIIIPIIYKYIGSMHNGICVRLTETKYLFQDVIFTKKQPELHFGERRRLDCC
jgi:hypothetical protein